MLVLGLDTSLQACSAALLDSAEDRVLGRAFEPMETGQAERLAVMVRDLLAEASVPIQDLDRFAATCGPGTFTGIRIGLAFVRGLALATGRPALGIPTLEAIAAGIGDNPAGRNVAVAVDARRGEVYFQLFGSASGAPQLLPIAAAAGQCQGQAVVLAGTGAALLMPHLTDAVRSAGSGSSGCGRGRKAGGAARSGRLTARSALHPGARRPPAGAGDHDGRFHRRAGPGRASCRVLQRPMECR